jgi:hypothetical protein
MRTLKANARYIVLATIAILFMVGAVLFIEAVTPRTTPTENPPIAQGVGLQLPITSLDGTWYYEKNGTKFAAEVANDAIKIDIVTDSGDSMAYWHGAFKDSGDKITSEALKDGFTLSPDETKDFQVGDDSLSFKFTALGVTTMVVLHRA